MDVLLLVYFQNLKIKSLKQVGRLRPH